MGGTVSRLKLGVLVRLESTPEECLSKVKDLGFPTCQVGVFDPFLTDQDVAIQLHQTAERLGIEITMIFTHCRRGQIWNLVQGPATIGLVPIETRREGVERLKRS